MIEFNPGRKFYITCFLLLASLGLLFGKVLTAEQWIAFNQWVLVTYCGANVLAKAAPVVKP